MESNVAYFARNNPFATSETSKKYDFIFRFVYEEYNLDRQYRFNVREDENVHNLIDKIAPFIGKSMKLKKEEMDKDKEMNKNENTDNPEMYLPRNKIKFLTNGKDINHNMKFKTFNDIKHSLQFKILNCTYDILINTPKILKIDLPKSLFVNFPIYPSTFDTVLVDTKKSTYIWYKSLDKTVWTEIGTDFCYTPTAKDVNYYIKLNCVPNFEGKTGETYETISENTVQDFLLSCPFEKRSKSTTKRLSSKNFRVVSYNILSDQYVKNDRYPYCSPEALDIDYRKQLILKELKGYKADIICLQEVDYKVYKNYLREEMYKLNYKSLYDPKTGKSEGLTVMYYSPTFTLLRKHCINIGREIETNDRMSKLWNKVQENEMVARKLVNQNTIFQCVVLQSNLNKKEIVVVGNTHLFYHPDARHVRLLQTEICLRYINRIVYQIQSKYRNHNISLVFCGDFNSSPISGVFELFTKRKVSKNAADWSQIPGEKLSNIELNLDKNMQSAYGTPKYTNYTQDFQGCLDYIFYETKLELTNVVPLLTDEELSENIALPSPVVPSDHIALIADLKWK